MPIELSGKKFGKLLVIKRVGTASNYDSLWLCKCDCGKEKIIRGYQLRSGNSKSCGCEWGPKFGYLKSTSHLLVAKSKPTIQDIFFAAGFYEGEGSCSNYQAMLTQKDPFVLQKMKQLFGGNLRLVDKDTKIYRLTLTGSRARGFLMTIYKFLSPRRQEQIKKAICSG